MIIFFILFGIDMDYIAIIKPENKLENDIISNLEWQSGASWGVAREGHPENKNIIHIVDVLNNIDQAGATEEERKLLRLVALVHDTFKHKVNIDLPRIGDNNHAVIARKFIEDYTSDPLILNMIELHDEAFNCWRKGDDTGKWDKAEERLNNFISKIGEKNLKIYYMFFKCDNETGNKEQDSLKWFEGILKSRKYL